MSIWKHFSRWGQILLSWLSFTPQALDGDFSDDNRNRCRVATAPLIEAVENLTTFASNPEFSSIPARISSEVRPWQLFYFSIYNKSGDNRWCSVCAGFCSSGAHPPVGTLHARQLHPPAEDGTLIGDQPQRPAHLVGPGRPLAHRLRLHQGSDHGYKVSQLLNLRALLWSRNNFPPLLQIRDKESLICTVKIIKLNEEGKTLKSLFIKSLTTKTDLSPQ